MGPKKTTTSEAKAKPPPPSPAEAPGSALKNFLIYSVLLAVMASYSARAYSPDNFKIYVDRYPALKPVDTFFQFVDDYSPFHEFINDLPAEGKKEAKEVKKEKKKKDSEVKPGKGVIMTKEELAEYDGTPDGKGIYLAVLGQVFDVSKGKDHYAKGGGYGFFSGKDGSRAFVSGQFDDEGLIDDVSGLSHQDYVGLQDWVEFYHKDYKYVGKVVGNFYDAEGKETAATKEFATNLALARQESDKKSAERKMYPQCNTEWSKKKGHRVWCTAKTGGEDRGWVGRPRQLFLPGRAQRCSCIKDFGPPSTDLGAKTDHGDLLNPHVKEYEGCDVEATSCQLKPPEPEEDEE